MEPFLISLIAGSVGATVAIIVLRLMATVRKPIKEPVQSVKKTTPDPVLPYFIDTEGDRIHLAFHQDSRWGPKVQEYIPHNDCKENYDCHDAALVPGEAVVRWPNPLTYKIHSLCLDHIVLPERESFEQNRKPENGG